MKLNFYLVGSVLVAAIGGLLFGFDTAVISGTKDALTKLFSLSDLGVGITVSSALVGTIFGALGAGKPADAFGRRATLLVIAVLYIVSAIGCAFPWDWYSLLCFRFIGGVGIGAASVVSPLYIAEISPARYRGRLVALTQFNIVLGILIAFFLNYLIHRYLPGEQEWRWMFGVVAIPSVAFFVLLFFTPQSPRWLMSKGREDEARKELRDLGTDSGNVETEMAAIRSSLDLDHHSATEAFFQRKYLKPILLAVAIAMFNQLSGINALMYYAPTIFQMAGSPRELAMLQSVAVGGVNLLFTMLALPVIDHFGRRKLMFVGSIGYILSLGCCAWAFFHWQAPFAEAQKEVVLGHDIPAAVTEAIGPGGLIVMVSLFVFIASHAFGQGAVIWVFISEIFPNRIRARGQALGCFTHWIMATIISLTFPMIAACSGAYAFAFYCAMTILQLIWVLRVMSETKGVPLEEIQKKLGIA